jgi:hypothetical protein
VCTAPAHCAGAEIDNQLEVYTTCKCTSFRKDLHTVRKNTKYLHSRCEFENQRKGVTKVVNLEKQITGDYYILAHACHKPATRKSEEKKRFIQFIKNCQKS